MSTRPRNRFGRFALPGLIIFVGVAAYAGSFRGAFVFDDDIHIVESTAIRSLWSVGPLLSGSRRPVVMLSLAGNYALGSLDTFGYHLVNLAIHLAAGLALFGLVRRTLTLARLGTADQRTADRLAFAAALVWLVHPLTTQSVTYVIQRSESLMGLFYLLTLVCLLRGALSSRAWAWYTGAVAACWLGMGSKEVMITAPLVALVYDRIFLAGTWRDVFRRRWALYVGFSLAAVWVVADAGRTFSSVAARTAGFGLRGITWHEYLGTQGGVILHYLRLAVWPDRLCLDYWWPVAGSLRETIVPCAVVASLLAASLVALRYRPALGFLGLSFFLILAPTSSIMPIDDLAMEHRMYLPLAVVAVLAVLGLDALAGRLLAEARTKTLVETSLLVVVVLALAARTIDRNRDYESPVAMWKDVLAAAPNNPRAYYNLGNEVEKLGDDDRARANYRRALDLAPNYVRAHNNLGVLLERQGDAAAAERHYREAIRIDPAHARSYNNLGVVLARRGEREEAARQFQRAIEIEPDYAEVHYHLAGMLEAQGNLDRAIDHYRHAVRIRADYSQAHYSLGLILAGQGSDDEAISHFRQTLGTDPDNADAHYNLGVVRARQGKLAEAIAHYQDTLRVAPTYAAAHNNLGIVHAQQGDLATAVNHFEQAVRIEPDFAEAHDNLGTMTEKQGNSRLAAEHFRRALELQPDLLGAAAKLVRILATSRDPAARNGPEAVGLAEQLAKTTGRNDAAVLDMLAAAYAEAGRWDEAVATAGQAIELARAAGQTALAEQIDVRLRLYGQQQPYRASAD